MELIRNMARFPSLIGWPGGVGVALLVATVVLSVTLLVPVRDENTSLRTEIAQVKTVLQQPKIETVSDAQKLDDFIASLAPHDELNNALSQLHELAARHGLSLKNSEYHPSKSKTGHVQQLRITVKTEGGYAELRNFLQEISATLPSLAISQLSFARLKISDVNVESAIEFTLYYSQ
jgi:Tfp pilus assembly protein PilO